MKLSEIVEKLDLEVITGDISSPKEITRGYSGDLMSDVIAHAFTGGLWVTMQVHMNVVAIASMKDISAVILTKDRKPQPETVKKAESEGVTILGSGLTAFELAGRLYRLGITGE